MPALLYTICLIPPVFIKSASEKINILLVYDDFDFISLLNLFFFNGTVLIFAILSIYEIRIFLNKERIKNIKPFRIVFILLMIAVTGVIINCIGLIMESNLTLRIDSMLFNIVLFTPFFLGYRYPNFMQNLSVEISKEKYKQSQINGLNVDSVISRLNELCKIENIYTDPKLNINIVSEKLQITVHQLSEILNQLPVQPYRPDAEKFRIISAVTA